MKHDDHLSLIRAGIEGAGPAWLELGAGTGEFTMALADLLGPDGDIIATDIDRWALQSLEGRLAEGFPDTAVLTIEADFTQVLPEGPFDGVLAANSLHFVEDLAPVLAAVHEVLAPGGRLVIVEYGSDKGNPYVPHPIPFARWETLAAAAGFSVPRLVHHVPSRFLGSIYGAVTERVPGGTGA
jgi:ubiquinone/menaquinone biosynthesis C-methylase UbiE